MRTILYIVQKEFLQIFRNKSMLPIIFIVPMVQLIVLVNAATQEMKRINMCVVDEDLSSTSRQLVSKFEGSPFYVIKESTFSMDEALSELKKDRTDVILHIPANFEKDLVRNNASTLQILINAINGSTAGLINAYTSNIVVDYNKSVKTRFLGVNPQTGAIMPKTIGVQTQYWYNPQLNYKNYMVPAVLVMLVTIIGMYLSSMNLVREKELGTIEQINVTPIKKYQFIAGKLIPFWIIALFELAFGLVIGKLIFQVPIIGNIGLVFLVAAVYLLAVMGVGVYLSTVTQTQQQAMFLAFFLMMIFILMSGVFTPTESMPEMARKLNYLNPVFYFMKVIRMVLLKGSGLRDILPMFASLSLYSVIILTLSVRQYKKVA